MQGHMILFWKQSATCFANMAPTVLMRLWNLAGSMNFIGKSCAAIMRTEDVSAMGKNALAEKYYNHAIEIFYELRRSEDIAEVYYNRALNYLMQRQFKEAEHDLLFVMKVIEKLHLNSLRVCNLSKLYALLALIGIMQDDRFTCERYLLSCRQFLKKKRIIKTKRSYMIMPNILYNDTGRDMTKEVLLGIRHAIKEYQ